MMRTRKVICIIGKVELGTVKEKHLPVSKLENSAKSLMRSDQKADSKGRRLQHSHWRHG